MKRFDVVFFVWPRSGGDIEAIRNAIDQAAEAGVSLGAREFFALAPESMRSLDAEDAGETEECTYSDLLIYI